MFPTPVLSAFTGEIEERCMNTVVEKRAGRRGKRLRHVSRRRHLSPLPIVMACAIALSSCFSSGFIYISHRSPDSTLLGFKLPASWKVFDTQQVLEALNGPISNAETKSIANGEWIESFSASKQPIADYYKVAETSSSPVGFVEARPLSPSERDGLNFASLRSEILGADPLAAPSPDPYNVTAYNEFASSNSGLRGVKLTTNIKLKSGATSTFSQIVEVDNGTNWIFGIAVSCAASCWGPNAGVIKQVLNSWAVKETKS